MDAEYPTRKEIDLLIQENKVPGLSLAIIENGVIVFPLEVGVDSNTLFEAASLSKPVFAYAVLKLVKSGKLDLDKPLSAYFSYPDLPNDKFITARMVLAHTCGLPNWRPKNEPLKIHFQPGERFSYSGEGYLYLQKVIEHLISASLEEFIKKNVFIPLGMNHSTFTWTCKKTPGHDAKGEPIAWQEDVPPNAAFTLHTNTQDYSKFVIAVMYDSEMFRPQIRVPVDRVNSTEASPERLSNSVSWGLGWGKQSTEWGDSFWHWGDNKGYKSFVVGFESSKKAIVIFTNGENGLSIISKIIQKYFPIRQPAFDWLNADYSSKTLMF